MSRLDSAMARIDGIKGGGLVDTINRRNLKDRFDAHEMRFFCFFGARIVAGIVFEMECSQLVILVFVIAVGKKEQQGVCHRGTQ